MSYWLSTWFGALVPTFLLSRLTLLLVKRGERHKFSRLAFAHGLALGLGMLLVGFNEGPSGFEGRVAHMLSLAGILTGLSYDAVPQAFWLIAEYIWRKGRRARMAEESEISEDT